MRELVVGIRNLYQRAMLELLTLETADDLTLVHHEKPDLEITITKHLVKTISVHQLWILNGYGIINWSVRNLEQLSFSKWVKEH